MNVFKKTLSILGILGFAMSIYAPSVEAAAEEIKLYFPEPYSSASNIAEGQSIGIYFGSLDFNMQNHPVLRGKYKMRWVGDVVKTPDDAVNAVATGAGHFGMALAQYIEPFDADWSIISTPRLFQGFEHFLRTMETPEWQAKQAFLEEKRGFKILKWTNSIGNFWLWTSKGPADSLASIKNQKIRYGGQQSYANALKALGVVGVSLPYTEISSALQTNMIDGVVSDIFAYSYYDLPRLAKFMHPIPLGLAPQALIVNAKWWNSLPEKDREILEFVVEATDVKDYFLQRELDIVKWWDTNSGTTLAKPDPKALAEWENALQTSAAAFLKNMNPGLIDAINRTKEK